MKKILIIGLISLMVGLFTNTQAQTTVKVKTYGQLYTAEGTVNEDTLSVIFDLRGFDQALDITTQIIATPTATDSIDSDPKWSRTIISDAQYAPWYTADTLGGTGTTAISILKDTTTNAELLKVAIDNSDTATFKVGIVVNQRNY